MKENLHIEKKLILYESLLQAVFTYSFGIWKLRMKESHEIGVVQRKQLKMIIENFKINNRKLYKSCKLEPISQSTQINKWKILWHFEIPESSRKYQGKTRKAFVVYIHDILRNALKNGATAAAKQLYLL